MGSAQAVAAVAAGITRFLKASFDEVQPLLPLQDLTSAVLVRTNDFDLNDNGSLLKSADNICSVYVYRVDFNKTVRASWAAVGNHDGLAHLPLDVHFLLTAWAGNAEAELKILGRAMQCIESMPILSGPSFGESAGFAPNETVQIVLEEIGTEAVMRMFDSLPVDYRLSIPYVARIVRIDGLRPAPSPPVLLADARAKPQVQP